MVSVKIGLEIHQQLDGKKLFCNCPTCITDYESKVVVNRKLNAVAGETGQLDIAVSHEKTKDKEFDYQYFEESDCLVELDDEPPHKVNNNSLNTVLMFSRLCNANIVDGIQFMRKIVIDGSNTSGFQRTGLISVNGHIEVNKKKIGIQTICLEEDAAKIIHREMNKDIYNLSRLGIPLIEIATEPSITSGEETKEVAEHIGMILRSLSVKRGIGTIRQDVNISIDGGRRVEIKGVQDLHMLPEIVKQEIRRQSTLNELRKIKYRKNADIVSLTFLFGKSESKLIQKQLQLGGDVLGIIVPGCKGLLGKEIQTERRLGSELSDYAKIKSGCGGIFHSDELPNYGITQYDIKKIEEKLGVKNNDAFILVVEKRHTAEKALNAVMERLEMLSQGVISEVRNALPNGSSSYLRPMPGASRMYPETDIPICIVDKREVENWKLPKLLNEEIKEIEKELSSDLAALIVKEGRYDLYKKFVQRYKTIKPSFIAETILPKLLELKREFSIDIEKIKEYHLDMVFNKLSKNLITKENISEILLLYAQGKEVDFSVFKPLNEFAIKSDLKKIIKENKGASFSTLMGIAMKHFNGKVDGKRVNEMLRKLV